MNNHMLMLLTLNGIQPCMVRGTAVLRDDPSLFIPTNLAPWICFVVVVGPLPVSIGRVNYCLKSLTKMMFGVSLCISGPN